MKLQDIHHRYQTDKGTDHNYVHFYDTIFEEFRLKENNILEIGVLHGGSLKMWHDFFENSTVYGVEDFSQQVGFEKPVIQKDVEQSLLNYPRTKLLVFNSENRNEASKHLKNLKFNIIIDDACHSLENQIKNIEIYYPFLAVNGYYIIEDVKTSNSATACMQKLNELSGKHSTKLDFNVEKRSDDRIVYLRN